MFFFSLRRRGLIFVIRWVFRSGIGPQTIFAIGTFFGVLLIQRQQTQPFSGGQLIMAMLMSVGLMALGCVAGYAQLYVRHGGSLSKPRTVELEPEAGIRLRRAMIYVEQQEWASAAQELTIAVEISPCARLYHWRAVARQRAGFPREALKDTRAAIQAYRQEGQPQYAAALEQVIR